jgi:hypothetical protein
MACLLRVSTQSVLNWIRAFGKDHDEKPDPTGNALILELDEMGHSLKQKRRQLWLWQALEQDTGRRLDWEGGCRDKTPLKKMLERL